MSLVHKLHLVVTAIRATRKRFLVVLLAFLVTSTSLAQAVSPPSFVTYQGRILNASGVPVSDNALDMEFRFYNALAGGTCLWSNDDSGCGTTDTISVTLSDGLFSVNLGDTGAGFAAIPDTVFADNASVFLQVHIEGETLSPRKQLTAAPYALNSETLDGIDSTGFLSATGDSAVGAYDFTGAFSVGGGLTTVGNGAVSADIANGDGDLFVKADLEVNGELELDGTLDVDGSADFSGGFTNSAGEFLMSGGSAQFTDDVVLSFGTGDDLQIFYDATGSGDMMFVSATGSLVFDNTNTTGDTDFVLGTDDSNTSFRVLNNSGTPQFSINGAGTANFVGNVTLSDLIISGGNINPSAALIIGDGGDTLAIDSSDWDISSTGAITGVSFDANGSGNSISNIDAADLTADSLDFAQFADALSIDANTSIALGSSNFDINLNSTGDFAIQNGATDVFFVEADTGLITMSDDFDLAFNGSENMTITSDLVGSVNMLSLTANLSDSAGTTRGLLISQGASASSVNGLDNAIVIDNLDGDLPITNGLVFSNSGGGGITNEIVFQNGEILKNSTDDLVQFVGSGGGDDTDLQIDLDGTAPTLSSSTDTKIIIAEELVISNGAGNSVSAAAGDQLTLNADNTIVLKNNAASVNITDTTFDFNTVSDIDFSTSATDFLIGDNNGSALVIAQSGNNYLEFDTTNASEVIRFGNATTNPDFSFLGSGDVLMSTGALKLSDNSTFTLGTGNDLTFLHNGTNSVLTSATGNLLLDNTNVTGFTQVQLGTDDASTAFQVLNDSGAVLFKVEGGGVFSANTNFDTDVTMTFDTAENLEITSDLGATGNIIDITATPSGVAGNHRAIGVTIPNAGAVNLTEGLFIDNQDTDTSVTSGVSLYATTPNLAYTNGIAIMGALNDIVALNGGGSNSYKDLRLSTETDGAIVFDLSSAGSMVKVDFAGSLDPFVKFAHAGADTISGTTTGLLIDLATGITYGAGPTVTGLRVVLGDGNGGTTIGLDLDKGGTVMDFDIEFQNGETLTNAVDGLVDITGELQITLDGDAVTTAALCGNQGAGDVADTTDVTISDCSGAPVADYAEQYPVAQGITYGDIVVPGTQIVITQDGDSIVQLVKSSEPYQGPVVGIVSDNYGDFTSAGYNLNEEDNPMPVALVGRVPVNVTNENGAIAVGDFVTTSSTPGYGMKALGNGRIIGMALGSFSGQQGQVMVQVINTFYQSGENEFILHAAQAATLAEPEQASSAFTLRGSAWDAVGGVATAVEMQLVTEVTDTDDYRLSVRNTAGTQVAFIDNTGTVNASGDLIIGGRLYPSDRGAVQTSKYIFYDGSEGPGGDFMRTNASGWGTGSYDFAEMFPSKQPLAPGDVVVFDSTKEHVRRSDAAKARGIAGIVSTRPGFLAGDNKKGDYPIALSGRVPTNVSAENGPIAIGDPLTTASKPGFAMRATEPGMIVGYALEAFDGTKPGQIIVFVNVGYDSTLTPQPLVGTQNTRSTFGSRGTNLTTLNMEGDIYLQGHDVLNARRIAGLSDKWSIEEDGTFKTRSTFNTVIESFQNELVETSAVTSLQVSISLFGTGSLSSGEARIVFEDIDPKFNDIISSVAPIHVVVTPGGPATLFVSQKDHNGFTVQSVGRVSEGLTFDWMVSGFRKDYEPKEALEIEEEPEAVEEKEEGSGETLSQEPSPVIILEVPEAEPETIEPSQEDQQEPNESEETVEETPVVQEKQEQEQEPVVGEDVSEQEDIIEELPVTQEELPQPVETNLEPEV